MTQLMLIPIMKMRLTICHKSSGVDADWQFFGEATNCIEIALDYIMGLN